MTPTPQAEELVRRLREEARSYEPYSFDNACMYAMTLHNDAASTIERLQAELAEERGKFRRETLRASQQAQLLLRWMARAESLGCRHEQWAKACETCDLMRETKMLMETPLNAAAAERGLEAFGLLGELRKIHAALLCHDPGDASMLENVIHAIRRDAAVRNRRAPVPDDSDGCRFHCTSCGHTYPCVDETVCPPGECPVCGEETVEDRGGIGGSMNKTAEAVREACEQIVAAPIKRTRDACEHGTPYRYPCGECTPQLEQHADEKWVRAMQAAFADPASNVSLPHEYFTRLCNLALAEKAAKAESALTAALARAEAAEGERGAPRDPSEEAIIAGMEKSCVARPSIDDERYVLSIWHAMWDVMQSERAAISAEEGRR